jgi:mannosyltransferase
MNFIALTLLALKHRPYIAMSTLLVLLVGDLFLSTHPPMGLTDESPAVFWPAPAWLADLQSEQPGRIDTQNLFHANVGEVHSLEDIRGISPLKPAVVEQYEALPRRLRWQLLNVTHVLATEQLEVGLTPVVPATESLIPGEELAATIYRFDDAYPRAWLVYEAAVAQDQVESLTLIQEPAFDPARQVILTAGSAAAVSGLRPPESPGMVEVVARLPGGGLDMVLETADPAILVISEWYRPGWQVKVDDGEALPLVEANGGLMALPVTAGRHAVSLRYRPWDVPAGIALSLITLALVLVAAWRWRPAILPTRPVQVPAVAPTIPAEEPKLQDSVVAGINISWRWLLVMILLAGFGLRVYRLGYQELRGDEAFSFGFTRLPIGEVIPEIIDQGDPHSPLPYLLLNVWTGMAGISELALRYPSALAGTLLLAVLFALGRRMGGRATGFVVAGLACVAPGLIWLSQDGRTQYMMVTLFSALATLIIVRPSPRRAAGYWTLYLVACLLTVYNHLYGIFALVSHGLYLYLTPSRWRQVLAWAGCGLVTALGLGVWLFVSARSVVQAGHLAAPAQPELARHLVAAGRELVIGPTFGSTLDRWLFLGGFLLVLTGGVALARSRRTNWATMLLVWLGLGVYAMFLVRFSRGTFNTYYITILSPAWWLLISAALVWLWVQGRGRRGVAALALLIYAVAVLVALRNYYFEPFFGRSLGYRAVAAHLAQQAGPDDLFIVPFPDPVWDYYLRDSDLPRTMLPISNAGTAEETEATLALLAQQHGRLWFVPYQGWDRENIVGVWLESHMLREEQTMRGRTDLHAYRPLTSVEAIMTPLDHRLGHDLRLTGAYLTVGGLGLDLAEVIPVEPGDELEVTLLWEAFGPTEPSYTVFVHLLDENGRLIGQHDGIPAEGTRPTTTWQPGEMLLDRHRLEVPEGATGLLTLVVGLYDSATVERVVFNNGLTALPLTKFLVAP